MNLIMNILIKLGIRKNDLDYHLIRASMVIIFLFFGYQKWFEYEAGIDPIYQPWTSDLLDVPRVRRSGRHLVFGNC